MLEISHVKFLNEKDLNIIRKRSKKNQILLYDTHRRLPDFFNKIQYRRNGKYDDIPHFVVSKSGEIFQIFDTKYSSKTFDIPSIDKTQIKIAIENLGSLTRNDTSFLFNNWIGDVYRSDPYVKNWRGSFNWDPYTEEQFKSLNLLCKELCEKNKIEHDIVSSSAYSSEASKFKGIVSKSNFSDIYIHINPSFNFKKIISYE